MKTARHLRPLHAILLASLVSWTNVALADQLCGEEGVWVQILGAGGPELDDSRGGPSYLIWHNNAAKALIDTGPGASVSFDRAQANFEDLQVVALSHLHADHTSDFPAFVAGSAYLEREEPLIVLGPDSNLEGYPDTETFIGRLLGPNGAYPYLASYLTYKSGSYRIRVRNVPSTGKRRWSRFASDDLRLSAIPVNHGDAPGLAWKVEVDDKAIVFTGDFNNLKDVVADFAKGADAIVAHHAIPENSRGNLREEYALPSQLGRIASQAETRMLILSHRTNRTRGKESISRKHIEENYDGYVLFADDMECWGL